MNNNIDINEIVGISQMPVVFEKLEKIGTLIDERIKDLDKLECTEENKQEVKKRRTEINNTLKVLEDRRKEIKNSLLEPYNTFNEKYEKECKDKLFKASELLFEKIGYIEDQQRLEKENELREFANQHIKANNLEKYIKFEDIGLNITLSASIKSLKDQILEFINKVIEDIKLIELEEYKDEIMFEYLQSLNFADAKVKVICRKQAIDKYKEAQQEIKESNDEFKEVAEKVVEAIKAPKEIIEDDEIIKVSFTLTGTKGQIKKVKDLIIELGINYE